MSTSTSPPLLINVPGTVTPGSLTLSLVQGATTFALLASGVVLTPGATDVNGNPTTDVTYTLTQPLPNTFLVGQSTLVTSAYTAGTPPVAMPSVSQIGDITAAAIQAIGLSSDFFYDFDDPTPNPTVLLNPDGAQMIGAAENDEGVCVRFLGRTLAASAVVTLVVYDTTGNINIAFTGLEAQVVRMGSAAIVGFDFPASPILPAGDWYFRFRIVENGRTWDSSLLWFTKSPI